MPYCFWARTVEPSLTPCCRCDDNLGSSALSIYPVQAKDAPHAGAAQRLLARARALSPAESAGIPWLPALNGEEREIALRDLKVVQVDTGELLCRVGRPVTYWFGVIDGLLKMSNDTALGVPITFTGIPPGGWFGEGTVIKREAYRYNIQALRRSVVAGLSEQTFHWLLDRSIPFNRFITQQLNERLGQFIGAREIDRMPDTDGRVARSLAALFHPVLYPGVGGLLRITQQELGYLVGLSRQRVNEALKALQAAGLIAIEYGGLRVLDLERLRRFGAG
ncbi:MAG: Crp/Fnr family transcriptional regulator [Burkholderiales bacterium]|nr:Crp/Fnr family transcriptional regulator [Burkholderiales bacterium]